MVINDFLAADMRKQMQADGYDLLDEFHAASKVGARFIGWDHTGYDFSSRSEAHDFKIANVKRRNGMAPLLLPEPSLVDARLDDLRTRRKSTRRFRRSSVCLRNLGTLLNHGYGFATDDRRSVPSGGGVYPLELYVIALNVTGLPTGTYHYLPHEHALERCGSDDSQPTLAQALDGAFDEGQAGFPAFHIVVTAAFIRNVYKYGLRGYRLCLLEAGHVVHAIILASLALDLGSLPNLNFYDASMDRFLDIDGVTESVLYMCSVGESE